MNKKLKFLTFLTICFILFPICSNVFAIESTGKFQPIDITNEIEQNKIENTDILEESPEAENLVANNAISTFSLDNYEGTLIEDKTETTRTYVNRDGKNYIYARVNGANFISIKRYCFETGEYKVIFRNYGNFDVEIVRGYHIQDKVIYTAVYSTTAQDELRIVGYDTQTETLTYDQTFPIPNDTYDGEFYIDRNHNLYFVNKTETETEASIVTYDKNGNFIDSITQPFYDGYDAINITGTDKNNTVLFLSLYATSGYSSWWDDCIIKINNGKFINEDVYLIREYAGVEWKFLSESDTYAYAYNQFGEFFEINYNASNELGISYEFKENINIDGSYVNLGYLNSFDDTYAYLGTENGYLYIFNWKTYQIEKSLSIGENKTIVGVHKVDSDKIFVEYYNTTDRKYYILTLSISSDYSSLQKNIEITDHTALTHTKAQIKNKYNDLSIVNTTSDLYEVEPSIKSPYAAGSLKSQVKTDTINQINYFRWLSGINDVTINDEYMEYSQKGAVVLGAINSLTHFPSQPTDMEKDFYDAGYAATSAGIGTSANCSSGSLMAYSIKGYVDDTRNVYPNVGHRLSILDPKAESASFGFASRYGVVNIFRGSNVTVLDNYYSWPSPGYFPVESIDADAMWSIGLPSSGYNLESTEQVVIKANGKEYSSVNGDFTVYTESFYNTYYFHIPEELKTYLVGGTNAIQHGKKVEVEVYGLSDNLGNTYVIKYPINFFSLDKVLTGISLPKSTTIKLGNTKKLELTNIPAGSELEGTIKWSSSDSNIISISEDGTMLAKAIGEVTITAEVDGYTATTTVKVVDYMLGDVNGDGNITLADYAKILAHVKETKLLTEEEQEVADVNGDGNVTLADYAKVLAHVKETSLL